MKNNCAIGWTEEQDRELRKLAGTNRFFFTEIADQLGRRPASVVYRAKKLGLASTRSTQAHRLGKWNSIYSAKRGAVMKYFVTHTWDETRERFGLTQSQLRNLMTAGYRMPEFKHLRKDTRDHSPWSAKQLQFLLTHAGLRPRKWIMAKLKRGTNVCHIKERLQALGLSSRTLQGLTITQFREAFGSEPGFFLQTDAGPTGLPTRWRIIPWVWLDQELKAKRLKTAKEFRQLVTARAMFQEWIFEGNALKKMKRICKEAQA